jgi:siroheme synthase (precorrin-2 oxidase/ferrochelatase)
VDDASDGTCHLPASIREGELLLSLSSHAASPALMKHLKQNLRETVRGYGELLELLRDLREELKSLTPEARDAFIKQATQKELLELSQRNPALARFQLQRLLTPDTYSLGHINA